MKPFLKIMLFFIVSVEKIHNSLVGLLPIRLNNYSTSGFVLPKDVHVSCFRAVL